MSKMRRLLVILVMVGVAWVSYRYWDVTGEAQQAKGLWTDLEGSVAAPDLPADAVWFNTPRAVTWADLQGKITVLFFWSYGQQECFNLLADLYQLQERFGKSLVLIGVHTPQFPAESRAMGLRDAIRRSGINFPVVQDNDHVVAKHYGVTVWPTLYIVDPRGNALTKVQGAGVSKPVGELLARMEKHFAGAKALTSGEVVWPQEPAPTAGVVQYPGAVAADPERQQLYIADTGHHRVLVTALDGAVRMAIGDGTAGYVDGPREKARFREPRGIARLGDALYVADTSNHVVRKIALDTGAVTTAAGTGLPAVKLGEGGAALKTALLSPWGVATAGGQLVLTMAGLHQVWRFDPAEQFVAPVAGSGRPAQIDALSPDAAFAQPAGIAATAQNLVVADSLTGAIRRVPLQADARVATLLAGTTDESDDGAARALLHHPDGVAATTEALYVADTYHQRIVRIDPREAALAVAAGTGSVGYRDGAAADSEWNEPAGVGALGAHLYVADTNNHRIRVLNVETQQVTTLDVRE